VIIAGYGKGGRALARALDEAGVEHLILTLSPQGASEAEADGLRVIRGNYGRQYELSIAGLRRARLLVVPDDDPETTRRVVRSAKALHPELPILASARLDGEIEELRRAGADRVVSYEREGVRRLVQEVLDGPAADPESPDAIRLTRAQRENADCAHAADSVAVVPRTDGCEECLALGEEWVHLRLCMTCGHVGCCDESKNKHATAHFHATGHPVIRSHQPGESWAWCYVDEIVL
jgi:CPA2 family monovalent cation:H+ antiporter-2